MNGLKKASVWIQKIMQWVPMSQVTIIQFYAHEGKRCAQFTFDDKVLESYIEYKEF
jgi:hypothetical protein